MKFLPFNKKLYSPSQLATRERFLYRVSVISLSAVAMLVIIMVSLMSGTVEFTFKETLDVLLRQSDYDLANKIISNVRLPRILTGLLVGMNLAVAGTILQGILRNPMAAPNVIGVNAGAGLGAVLVMILLPAQIQGIPIAAFIGALLSTFIVYFLSRASKGQGATVHIILAGVAFSSLLTAITNGLMMLNRDELEVTFTWLLGSLSGRGWSSLNMLFPYTMLGLLAVLLICPKLNIFVLGDELGNSVGINVNLYRIIFMLLAAVLAGSAVSVAGTIGFIGLIAPHIARILVGNDHKYLIPLSSLLGASILVGSDTLARTLFIPLEIPVGVVTAILGAPFFLFLLYRKKRV